MKGPRMQMHHHQLQGETERDQVSGQSNHKMLSPYVEIVGPTRNLIDGADNPPYQGQRKRHLHGKRRELEHNRMDVVGLNRYR